MKVARMQHIHCPTALPIARVDEAMLRHAMLDVNGPDVDAIVCVRADLACARLADEAERWLNTPVVSMATALLWHTLRKLHTSDRLRGFGFLLREHYRGRVYGRASDGPGESLSTGGPGPGRVVWGGNCLRLTRSPFSHR
jgi:hypothetical protein